MKRFKFTPEAVVGFNIDDARKLAEKNGYTIRVTQNNGNACIGTCDLRVERINVHIENNKIIKFDGLG